jgi:hypothetical protein
MCENYEYDPSKHHGKDRTEVLHETLLRKLMESKVLGDDFGMRFSCARTTSTTCRSITARIDLRYYMNTSVHTYGFGTDF